MRKIINYTMLPLLILLFLNGCNQINPSIDEDIFQFKGSYVGDNSAIGNLTHKLPNGDYLQGFELKTSEEPYGIILDYKDIEAEELDKEYKETAIYNASFIFALVQNADWITFNFDGQEYKITKKALQEWYKKELNSYTSEKEMKKLIQKYLKNENLEAPFV